MKKNPYVSILAMGFAFCAFCPFLATCNDKEVSEDLRKGIESISKIMVKYQSEFDNRVNFVKLQNVIDEIDESMRGYQGKAKDKLPRIRSLNSEARINYQDCVAPVFEWCISTNRTFDVFIPHINDTTLSAADKNLIWNVTVTALSSGLEKTAKSLELLTTVQYKTAELKNLFRAMVHDVSDDFGPKGFYGKERAELEEQIMDEHTGRKVAVAAFVGFLFGLIGGLVYGPIGAGLGLAMGFAVAYDIQNIIDWNQKQSYRQRIEIIDHFFKVLSDKIEKATEIVKEIDSALEEDKTNLHKLRGVIEAANFNKELLLSESVGLRVSFISDIQKLKNECTKYVQWHGYDGPFYKKVMFSMRHEAFTFCEAHRSNVKYMLYSSSTQNSTNVSKINNIIDQMDCKPYIPPVQKCH